MNAVVEVATAEVVAQVSEVVVIGISHNYLSVEVPTQVVTSATHVPTLGSHSISAVAPDHIFEGGLPTAA